LKLHEYLSKQLFAQHGIPIPKGRVASTPAEAAAVAAELGGKVVIKSQVLVGGRGKAGGIKVAGSPQEAEALARQILAMSIKGLPVRKVLVDEAADIKKEIYFGITNDRAARKPVVICSAEGGVEIEEVARVSPEKIMRAHVHPLMGLQEYQVRDIAVGIGLPQEHWKAFGQIAAGLFQTYLDTDATLAEINPLVITGDGRLVALDGKIVLDDNALYRHPDLEKLRDLDEESPQETQARESGLSYVRLDGEIGCLVNGAGLAMGTMDIVKHFGGYPANFLDIGGGASAEKVTAALRIILADPKVKAVLINIFGGITRCDVVARGVLSALAEVKTRLPIVVRLVGTNEAEGRRLLADANLITATTLAEAAQKAVAASKGV
jgi:succinyl-CoA synthetase beta subunit